jgi:aspartate/methionine/tyrosine aminotransferase
MLPREFFIEDRLEKFRSITSCNLGESGLRNFNLGDVLSLANVPLTEFLSLSLSDSPNRGLPELRTEIATLYESVNPDSILVTTGTSEALYLFFKTILKPGMKVGYFSPGFQALYEIPLLCGAQLNPVSILEEKKFKDLFANSDLVILNHPHNPTGTSFDADDWAEIKYWNQIYDRILLFDEHYRFLDFSSNLTPSGMDGEGNRFATGSITKSFGVTGLRIGWIAGEISVIHQMRSYKDYITHTVNPLSEYLALKLLQNRSQILPSILEQIKTNVHLFFSVIHELSSLDYCHPIQGGLVCYPRLKNGILSEAYADKLQVNCDVFVLPGINFECEGYIRVGFGESKERFQKGIERWINWEKKNAKK